MLRRQFMFRALAAVPALTAARSAFGDASGLPASSGPIALEARNDWTTVAGKAAYLSLYNSLTPGPAIETRAGDTLRIDFRNSLSADTNLHFHGLHVSPAGIADNSFLEVPSNESLRYEVPIPADHPSGLFWYHPHMHGAVASQVSRGLAGLIIVRGEFDDQQEVKETPESTMVLQDFALDGAGQVVEPTLMQRTQGREGPLVTVNGSYNPTIPIAVGGWVRLRILNASVSKFYRLRLEEHRSRSWRLTAA